MAHLMQSSLEEPVILTAYQAMGTVKEAAEAAAEADLVEPLSPLESKQS